MRFQVTELDKINPNGTTHQVTLHCRKAWTISMRRRE